MVKHHFHASSWPTNHPRFKHPVYGEVEKCNWNMECVKLWDANTAFFDSLPEEERLKIVGIKETKDAKKAELAASSPMGLAEQMQGSQDEGVSFIHMENTELSPAEGLTV